MGTFTVQLQVAEPARLRFLSVEALIDTGATHKVIPREVLFALRINAMERVAVQLVNERVVEYEVGEARLRLDGRQRTAQVVFGQEGCQAILGATTLELFNSAVDPVGQRLMSVPGLLKYAIELTRLACVA